VQPFSDWVTEKGYLLGAVLNKHPCFKCVVPIHGQKEKALFPVTVCNCWMHLCADLKPICTPSPTCSPLPPLKSGAQHSRLGRR
jgi:hypothetical protein